MLTKQLLIELKVYVERHLKRMLFDSCEPVLYNLQSTSKEILDNIEIEDFVKKNRKPTFHQILFALIDKKGVHDTDIYKKAGIDRRHFSKIRSNLNYRPKKNTAIALAFALELNKKEFNKLVGAAGYSLSESDTFDLVIQFCLEKKVYDFDDINQALDYLSLKPLIGIL